MAAQTLKKSTIDAMLFPPMADKNKDGGGSHLLIT